MNQDINRVELCGKVGTVRQNNCCANFTLCTEHGYVNHEGFVICESTWHNVVAFESRQISIKNITKDARVYLTGRIRNNRYTAADGTERVFSEILADSLTFVKDSSPASK